jgi:hypothetical protein
MKNAEDGVASQIPRFEAVSVFESKDCALGCISRRCDVDTRGRRADSADSLTHGRRYLPVLSKDPRVLASIAKTIVVVSHREKLS